VVRTNLATKQSIIHQLDHLRRNNDDGKNRTEPPAVPSWPTKPNLIVNVTSQSPVTQPLPTANVGAITSHSPAAQPVPVLVKSPILEQEIANEPSDWTTMIASRSVKNMRDDAATTALMNEATGLEALSKVDGYVDGENVDVLEHFFWGQIDGIAMELGALDGTPTTRSMTYTLEAALGWRRVLIEGNPSYRYVLSQKELFWFPL
jgi:hypothetical protein